METVLINNKFTKKLQINYLLPILAIGVAIYLLKSYFIPNFQMVMGVLLAPFIFNLQKNKFSYKYLFLTFLFLLIYYYLQIYLFLFLSAGCFILLTIEMQIGQVGFLPFLFLGTISPAMNYIVNTFTFSLRLELSKYSSILLNSIGYHVQNKGSYFIMPDGSEFNVDSACIGLNLFSTGLSLTILLIGFAQQRTKTRLNTASLLVIFLVTILSLILTNLLRIVALVLFKSPPETLQHDLIGIASLVIYTLLPIYFLITFLYRKQYQTNVLVAANEVASIKKNTLIVIVTSAVLFIVSHYVTQQKDATLKDDKLAKLQLISYNKQFKEDGVVEFSKKNILIYVKPFTKAYASDHPPSICWQGAGFKIEELHKIKYNNYEVLSAVLKKDKTIQYTAWWYDNGKDKTINQWKWRFAKGEPYRIINITTNNRPELDSLCYYFLKQNLF